MKHLFFGVALLIPLQAYTQMTNVYSDDQFLLSRIYAGINSTTMFPTDSIASYADVNFRLGIKSSLHLGDRMVFKTWGAIQMSKMQPVAGFNSFELMARATKKLSWHIGLIATPTTVLRPNPTTWESQVETNAQSTIIPGRPGTKTSYSLAANATITYGYFNHGDQWAHHLNLSVQDWSLAGYRLNDGEYFAAFTYSKDWLESTTTFSSVKVLATSVFTHLKKDVSLMLDTQYVFGQEEVTFLQTGLRKYIEASPVHLSGFFGLTYDWKTGVVIGQVFLNLH